MSAPSPILTRVDVALVVFASTPLDRVCLLSAMAVGAAGTSSTVAVGVSSVRVWVRASAAVWAFSCRRPFYHALVERLYN